MNKILLIIQREYLSRVQKKSFIIMTLLGPILIAALMALVVWLGLKDNQHHRVLVIDDTGGAFRSMEDGESFNFVFVDNLEIEEAKAAFKDSEYTSILHIPDFILDSERPLFYFKVQPSTRVKNAIERAVENVIESEKLKMYDIDKELYKKVKTNFDLALIKFTESGEEEEIMGEKAAIGFFFALGIYLFIFLYGVQVMRGVIEEKTNRIVEVIISSVKPFQLMMGKIVGIALVSLTQFLLWVILTATLVTVSQSFLFKQKLEDISMTQMTKSTELVEQSPNPYDGLKNAKVDPTDLTHPDHFINRINWPLMLSLFLFYFLGGYFFYSALFAAIGAAVDNDTDTQQFMLPVTIPLIVAYFIAFTIMENPESPAAFWGSIIPFTSPIIMIIRVVMGLDAGEYWQLILSMVLLVGGIILVTWLAGRIYRIGILMYGKKVNYQELWKWIRYNG